MKKLEIITRTVTAKPRRLSARWTNESQEEYERSLLKFTVEEIEKEKEEQDVH